MAAFRLGGYKRSGLPFTTKLPEHMISLCLLAVPHGERKLRLVPARVAHVGGAWLEYIFDEGRLDLTAASGAPVLNEKGKVVGINLGGGTMDGKTIGIADPVTSFVGWVSAVTRAN